MSSNRTFVRLRGFRDFAPADFALRRHLFSTWRRVALAHGFHEYDGPPLEPLSLYVEKSGEEIVGQLYRFRDKGGREVALRPEMTPSLARILAGRSRGMPKPIRWFSIPQLFRYERSQRGRLREHFQLNVDIVGEAGVAADAEALAVAIEAVRGLGLDESDFVARVNDRRLVTAVLEGLGLSGELHAPCLAVIDKAGRAGEERTREALGALGIGGEAAGSLLELVADGSLAQLRRRFGNDARVMAALEPLMEHRRILDEMGLAPYLTFDFTIVRGLAYYTGIVFELFDRAGELRAICGGGRYDRLLERVGGEALPAVGFGMGDVVLGEILRDRELAPPGDPVCDYFMIWVRPPQRRAALSAARRLRAAGRSVSYALRPLAVGKQLRLAARSGASRAVIIGPEEAASASATVRDLATGRQESFTIDALVAGAQGAGGSEPRSRPKTG